MRGSWAALALCGLGGCSWLFDADRIAPGPLPPDAATAADAAVARDLSVEEPADLAIPVDDLAMEVVDLAPADCSPTRFRGFPDGGAEPAVLCPRCGCLLDDFTALSSVRWQVLTVAVDPWTTVFGDGGLAVSSATAHAGEYFYLSSTARFRLAGDFDLLVDYEVESWAASGVMVLGLSAPTDGGYTNASSNAYFSTAPRWSGAVANSDGGVWSIDTPGKSRGTLRIERSGNQMCVSLRGEMRLCAPDTAAAPAFFSFGPLVQTCPSACGPFAVRLSNTRLTGPTRVTPP